MTPGRTTPILRICDQAKAKEFYVGFLGLKADWVQPWGNDVPSPIHSVTD
jgi:hypothetical protein